MIRRLFNSWHFEQALRLFWSQDYNGALAHLNQVPFRNHLGFQLYALKGMCHFYGGDPVAASYVFRRAHDYLNRARGKMKPATFTYMSAFLDHHLARIDEAKNTYVEQTDFAWPEISFNSVARSVRRKFPLHLHPGWHTV